MGKCTAKQTILSRKPLSLYMEKYQQQSQSQQVSLQQHTPQENTQLKINHSDFVTKQKTQIQDNYQFIGVIGDGNYSKVSKALHKSSKQLRAIKQIEKKKLDKSLLSSQNILQEIEVLKQLDHPNIVKLYEFYEDSKFYYLVTEYCEGGELFQKIENLRLTEVQAGFIMQQLLSAVKYLHSNNIVHRDLKPENLVLLSSNPNESLRIKIIDFGTSQIFNPNEKMGVKLGTSFYIAPEVISKKYNFKCDI